MQAMTPEEARRFLLDTARTATIATIRADGRPHVAPIWFDLDGEDVLFTTWHTSVKAANLRRDPRLSLCVDEEKPPYSYVIIEGEAEFIDDMDQLKQWATRIAGRYMGKAQAGALAERNAVPGELLVRVTRTKTIAHKNIAD